MKSAAAVSLLLLCGVVAGAEPDNTLEQLRQVSKDLSETLKHFRSHLDEEISRLDHADARVDAAASEGMQAAVRKFVTFRILAARGAESHSPVLADLDELQRLILQARQCALDSTAVLRSLAVVPVIDLDHREEAQVKARHDALVKARTAAERAAKQAWLTLPISFEEDGSADDIVQRAWDLGLSRSAAILPLRIPPGRRVTILKTDSYRMGITDSGREDQNGRHLFYQEEWVQRGPSVIRKRWRVALDTRTGEHLLLRHYAPVEVQGSLKDLYEQANRNSSWRIEPSEDAPRPSLQEAAAVVAELSKSRLAVTAAAHQFAQVVETALAHNDQHGATDGGLPDSFRAALFAIRGHLARVPGILAAENEVRHATETAESNTVEVERLAAWANRVPADSREAAEWDALQQRAEREIDLLRTDEAAASASLPPDSLEGEARFPAFYKNTIVRLRRLASKDSRDGLVRFVQEIWQPAKSMPELRGVQRTAVLVTVDPKTGVQTIAGAKTTYYSAAPGDPIEQVFDEHAADELLSWRTASLPD